jgi:hypothetical protein
MREETFASAVDVGYGCGNPNVALHYNRIFRTFGARLIVLKHLREQQPNSTHRLYVVAFANPNSQWPGVSCTKSAEDPIYVQKLADALAKLPIMALVGVRLPAHAGDSARCVRQSRHASNAADFPRPSAACAPPSFENCSNVSRGHRADQYAGIKSRACFQ